MAKATSSHWADHAAEVLVRRHPDKSPLVCAAGISPSGTVHIGNFREVITVEFVVRALRDRGRKVRFIYSWDDYDALRKVPANLPAQEEIQSQLRMPLARVKDPYGEKASYAAHFESKFEEEIAQLGIAPEYLYQNEAYERGDYVEGIRTALEHQDAIVEILNRARTTPLPEDWSCVTVFCAHCHRDTTKILRYEPPYQLHYRCECDGQERRIDFSREPGAKLLWRVDWPMRWAREQVDFEPGGKDHSSTGGSYDTGKEIVRKVWGREAPFYVQYDFVMAKGLGGKLSSSSGKLLTLSEALEIYEPEVIRYIFASRKPNLDFSIAFDLDVMKAYDDFDRTERYAYGVETGEEKKVSYERRIYEFSRIPHDTPGEYGPMPAQFSFRHLCNILQIHEGDLEKTRDYYRDEIKTERDRERFVSRARRAWRWITTYAPENFRFSLRSESDPVEKTAHPEPVAQVAALLREPETAALSEEDLANRIYQIMKGHGLGAKEFFPEIYRILIRQDQGPKLAPFIRAIGAERAARLLERAL